MKKISNQKLKLFELKNSLQKLKKALTALITIYVHEEIVLQFSENLFLHLFSVNWLKDL